MTKVSLVSTNDRVKGVEESINALGINPVKNQKVLIKPNFNTADKTPGSTHNDTLFALVEKMWKMGASSISLGERSYPPTQEVMTAKGVIQRLNDLDVKIIDFDKLEDKDWILFRPKDSHWKRGFRVARPILESECLVSTGCLKTHQFGGVFTLSLKLHVGVVPAGRHGYAYMSELHRSRHQQRLIAEINEPFAPKLVVMDGVDAFVDGGPATGRIKSGNVFIASMDRVAIDAVGVAVLKHLGSNKQIMKRRIFDQPQLARAAELGLGVSSPHEIELIAADNGSINYSDEIAAILGRE